MAEPEIESTDISVRAAEVAADVTEADNPQERRRLLSTFTKAVGSSAQAAGRSTRAARRGAGTGTRAARERVGAGVSYLTAQVIEMAPRLRVRDRAALQARFPGKSPDEIADALIEGAAHASAAVSPCTCGTPWPSRVIEKSIKPIISNGPWLRLLMNITIPTGKDRY